MTAAPKIDFDGINAAALAALPGLLAQWFPAGRTVGSEFEVGDLAGSPGASLKINTRTCKWADFAGDAKGGDPVSLYAAAFHRGDRVAAARELGAQLGISANVVSFPGQRSASAPATPKAVAESDWAPGIPPEDAPDPAALLAGWDHVYAYRGPAGELLRYVRRKDATPRRKKRILPLSWGTLAGVTGWHAKHAASPGGLYGLELLDGAGAKVVVVVEGEKSADAGRKLLPRNVVVTWAGGTNRAGEADWSPLAGRKVVIWPDPDKPGLKAAGQIAETLLGLGCAVGCVDVDAVAESFDAGEALAEGWTAAQTQGWVKGRVRPIHAPTEAPASEARSPDDADDHSDAPTPDDDRGSAGAPVPLGYDRGLFFYLSQADGQVHALSAQQHGKMHLIAMASLAYYWERSRFRAPNGVSWDKAADWLMQAARDRGVFDPLLIRGRGAWIDDGRIVLHQGDRLVVDGADMGLGEIRSRFVYERRYPLRRPAAEPATADEASKLLDLCCGLSWTGHSDADEMQPLAGYLLAGWCVIAPVCGALRWRPSIWITGPSGSGKGWVVNNILRPCLDGIATAIEGDTTDKGIEQHLRGDARPIIFDEAEQDGQRAIDRLQNILFLVRVSSSSTGGLQLKGTADGRGRSTQIRTCFAFASINPGMKQYADETRVTMLSLDRSDDHAAFAAIKQAAKGCFKGDFVDRLLARVYRLLPEITHNLEVFSDAATELFGSRRIGDQIAALLAGAYALRSSHRVDIEAAKAWIAGRKWQEVTAIDAESDETRLIRTISEYTVKISRETGGMLDRTIGDLLGAVRFTVDDRLTSADARQHLLRFGIRPEADHVLISVTHTMLRDRVLRNTAWAGALRTALLRLPGAVAFPRPVRFGHGPPTRAVQVPWALFGGAQ